MTVSLLHHTPLTYCDKAISKCWDKPYDPDNTNIEKIDRVVNKFRHESTVEHLTYTFEIKGVSRALLQEQSRHRIASYSVKSTRYTLNELKSEYKFTIDREGRDRAKKYVVFTDNMEVNNTILKALEELRLVVNSGVSSDIAKYCLPEAYKTEYIMTINARSLRNFLSLRSDKAALWEIRDLAKAIYTQLPEDHKFLFHIKNPDDIA